MTQKKRLKKFGEAILKGLDLIKEDESYWLMESLRGSKPCGCAVGLGLVGSMESFEKAWELLNHKGMYEAVKHVTGLSRDEVENISSLHSQGTKAKKIAKQLIKHGEIPKEDNL